MNKKIIQQLQQHKNGYTKEELIERFKKEGYAEEEIKESVNHVYLCGNPLKKDFWDFNTQKTYCNSSEKVKDFLLGFLAPIIGSFVLIAPALGLLVFIGFYFYALFYFFNKRKWISIGLFFNFILMIIVVIYLIVFAVSNQAIVNEFLNKILPFNY